MSDIRFSDVPCPVCGSGLRKLLYRGDLPAGDADPEYFKCTCSELGIFTGIHKCLECGCIYQSPVPEPDKIEALYRSITDSDYLSKEEERRITFERYADLVQCYLKKGTILEIGSYTGIFLEVIGRRGFDADGIELSDWARGIAVGEKGLNVSGKSLGESAPAREERYDAVCLWDVIEHYSRPVSELKHINTVLKDGGFLFLYTIDAGSLVFRIMGRKYPFLMLMHTVYFSKKTLKEALRKTGFELVLHRQHLRFVQKEYLYGRLDIVFGRFSFLVKALFEPYFFLSGKKYILLGFTGLMDIVARKIR